MMATLGSLAKKLRSASKVVTYNADALVKQIAEEILRGVVSDTPVDTGQAKSNWIVSINKPSTDTRGPYVPGKKGSTAVENIIATVEMGVQKFAAYEGGDAIHITNNLDYIEGLNDGSLSNQAPPDYVQKAILEALVKVHAAGYTSLHNIEVS